MSKCSIYFFYGGGGYPKYPCSRTCSDGVGRCYKVYDKWGNCHFDGSQTYSCTC
ncbi:hypothetical protein GPL10_21015 [Bacteroides fragilis]|nr:hypothetical protein [Bacteroides fragilis]MZI58063.1 hypothetical protein [Enterococcus durans]